MQFQTRLLFCSVYVAQDRDVYEMDSISQPITISSQWQKQRPPPCVSLLYNNEFIFISMQTMTAIQEGAVNDEGKYMSQYLIANGNQRSPACCVLSVAAFPRRHRVVATVAAAVSRGSLCNAL